MIDFFIKSTIVLSVFLVFYHLILEREKMHQFNRFFLLFSIVISIVIPFVSFEIIKEVPMNLSSQIGIDEAMVTKIRSEEKIDYALIFLWSLYGFVTFLMAIRFGRNIWKILSKSNRNPIVNFKNSKLVLIDEKVLPHTFLNYIFVNSEDYKDRNIEAELYTHELVHVTQKHTLDILFVEFLKTIFWFNPLFIFYKKAIQLNHEFLADQEIVKTYNDVPFYQNLLLQKGSRNQTIYLASNLNYLVTKKRLIMMNKRTSKTAVFFKKIAVLPVIMILVGLLCVETVAQEVKSESKTGKNQQTPDPEKFYSNTTVIIKDKKKNVVVKEKYPQLTKEQKTKVSPPRSAPEKKTPTTEEYEAFKNSEKYAVWIDGVHVDNSKLSEYQANNFVLYFNSFVHKNARSAKFPQEYQVNLLTEKGYSESFDDIQKTAPETIIITEAPESSKKKSGKVISIGVPKVDFPPTIFGN